MFLQQVQNRSLLLFNHDIAFNRFYFIGSYILVVDRRLSESDHAGNGSGAVSSLLSISKICLFPECFPWY